MLGEPLPAPRDEVALNELLSRPTAGVLRVLERIPGDVAVLGAGGKMGPTLCMMLARATGLLGRPRRVIAVSRFSSAAAAGALESAGIDVHRADLLDHAALVALPDAPNVFYLAGQKFGTRELPSLTWVSNTVVPALVAERFRQARIVAFSTGNVYPLTRVASGGSREDDPPAPVGEYAWSCLGRERVLEHASRARGTPIALVRLNYAVDLRYGVLVDLAQKVRTGASIDLSMGYVNVIWQGDACAQAIQCLAHAAVPPFVVNVAGPETLSVRAAALELGRLLGRDPVFAGREADDALLSNSSLAQSHFGMPGVSADTLVRWVGEWLQTGGATLGRPTHFEERGGGF